MAFSISTLGPCAEAMGLSVMMVFCIGVAQLPVMIGLAMHSPSVRVDMYSAYLKVAMDPSTNQSAAVIPTPLHQQSGSAAASAEAEVLLQASRTFLVAQGVFSTKLSEKAFACRQATRTASTSQDSLYSAPHPSPSLWCSPCSL